MNTLKFGNSEWYGTEGNILAYNDENGNFKPLPFDFSRGSSATRVNQQGLIETVQANNARVDYLDNANGALLLEPSRTNLITQSEAFGNSYWTKSGASIQGDASTAGSELITVLADRDFSSDTGFWVKSSAWTISGGKLNVNGSLDTGTGTSCWKPNFLTVGKTYQITFTISNYVSGSFALLQESGGTLYTSNGTFTQTFQAVSTAFGFNRSLSFGGVTNMSIDNVSLKEVQGFASPSADSPLGAFKLVEDTSTGEHFFYSSNSGGSVGNKITTSFFVKADTRNWCRIIGYDGSKVWFDLENGVLGTQTSAVGSIEPLLNGWYKISSTYTSSHASNEKAYLYLATENNSISYEGDGTSGIYIFGAQLEVGSYSTSLINTQGTVQTRLADSCIQTVPNGVIGQTEGTIYADVDFVGVNESITNQIFFIREENSNNGYLFAGFYQGKLNVGLKVSGSTKFDLLFGSILTKGSYKIAVVYSSGNTKVFVNGNQVGSTMTQTFGVNNFAQINSGTGSAGTNQLGDINRDLRVYNTALSDSEAISLTQV